MNSYITCAGRSDGAGAQIQGCLSTLLYAKIKNLKYIHTPFKIMEHNYQNDQNYEQKWEDFVNLGFKEMTFDQFLKQHPDVRQVIIKKFMNELRPKDNTLYIVKECHKFADSNPNKYLKIRNELDEKLNNAKWKPKLYFDDSKINFAVHIRRGNVNSYEQNQKFRFTGNKYYINLIKCIREILENKSLAFHIYSEGSEDDFKDISLSDKDIFLHINEDAFSTFHHLVNGDILIMSKSSFSYSSAVFCKGIIIYEPFWHKPMKQWIINDGVKLEKKLRSVFKKKKIL